MEKPPVQPADPEQALREEAEKRIEAKKAIFILGVVFAFTGLVLWILSFALPSAGFWLRFPILILALVYAFLYFILIGIPGTIMSKEGQEREMEIQLMKLRKYRRPALPPAEELTEEDRLELKELERLQQKWGGEEDLV